MQSPWGGHLHMQFVHLVCFYTCCILLCSNVTAPVKHKWKRRQAGTEINPCEFLKIGLFTQDKLSCNPRVYSLSKVGNLEK